MACWFDRVESSWNISAVETLGETLAGSQWGSGWEWFLELYGALSVIAGEMSCQSAILRGHTQTHTACQHTQVCTSLHRQASIAGISFWQARCHFSGPLRKACSAWCLACSHLDDGQRGNLIVTYELLIFCKATSLLYRRCLQPSTTRSRKAVTCSQQVSFEFIDSLSLAHTVRTQCWKPVDDMPHRLIGRLCRVLFLIDNYNPYLNNGML